MSGRMNWEKAKKKDEHRALQAKTKKRRRKSSKTVHPNSTAATKWGKTKWEGAVEPKRSVLPR